ncbi:MAG: hypothetical protein HGA90_05865, partial [Alphaproteobacteria bacterium]|nr:hypothetical protein [Alphaproteobacteria bacterium]
MLDNVTATIASGTSLSDAQNLGGLRLFGLVMPAAWTTANLTFQASFDGGATWGDSSSVTTSEGFNTVAVRQIDLAGNVSNIGSLNFTLDTHAPTVTIVVDDTSLNSSDVATVTITFSEAVSGLAVTDFAVGSGSLGGLTT